MTAPLMQWYAVHPPKRFRSALERLQAAGIRTEKAVSAAGERQIRYLGRVVADEDRLYKINATVDGWIREITPEARTGNFVRPDTGELLRAGISGGAAGLPVRDWRPRRFQATGRETETQIALTKANIQQAPDSLTMMGMSDLQADEMQRTRELTHNIRMVSPADGFIMVRNISPGQHFERGTEFFGVADLSRRLGSGGPFRERSLDRQIGPNRSRSLPGAYIPGECLLGCR